MQDFVNYILKLTLPELRQQWTVAWGLPPPPKISRTMLEKSLIFKLHEQAGLGLTPEQQKRLEVLARVYKRVPAGSVKQITIKAGTRLVRTWKGQRYSVVVKDDGFEYEDKIFTSLSEVAAAITGTRWNGWVFFGLKKSTQKQEAA